MRYLSVVILFFFADAVAADIVQVKSGSHDNYVRLVFQMPNSQKPVVLQKEKRLVELKFSPNDRFDARSVFNFIDRRRLKEISVRNEVVTLTLGCDCTVETHVHDKSFFVLDIVDQDNVEQFTPFYVYLKSKNFWTFKTNRPINLIVSYDEEDALPSPSFIDMKNREQTAVCFENSVVERIADLQSDYSYEDLIAARMKTNSPQKYGDREDNGEVISGYIALGLFQEVQPLIRSLRQTEKDEITAIIELSPKKTATDYPFADLQKCSEAYVFWSIFSNPHHAENVDKKRILRALDDLPAATQRWVLPILKARLEDLGDGDIVEEFLAQKDETAAPPISPNDVEGLSAHAATLVTEIPASLISQFTVIAEDESDLKVATEIKLSKILSQGDFLAAVEAVDDVELSYQAKLSFLKSVVDYAVSYGEEQDLLLLSSSSYWGNIRAEDFQADEFFRFENALNKIGISEISFDYPIKKANGSASKASTGFKEQTGSQIQLGDQEAQDMPKYSDLLNTLSGTDEILSQVKFFESGDVVVNSNLNVEEEVTQ